VCYWLGGEKEGQFPSNFGKKSSFKRSVVNTCQEIAKPAPTINNASTSEDNDQVFTYMTMGNVKFKIPAASTTNNNCISDDEPSPSFNNSNQQTCNIREVESLKDVLPEMPLVFYTDSNNKPDIPILLDSGTSDHYFTDLSLFTAYTLFNQPLSGLTTEKD